MDVLYFVSMTANASASMCACMSCQTHRKIEKMRNKLIYPTRTVLFRMEVSRNSRCCANVSAPFSLDKYDRFH